MDLNVFNLEKFNIIQDEENYYFFRALNMADNNDIEQGIIASKNGKIERIRTDRERYDGETKYREDSEISLEELYDHIKMHYRKDTNCISLTTNSNVAVNYGRGSYKDRYVMIKISKKEFGEKTVIAGQYMLQELYSRIEQEIENLSEEEREKILSIFDDIEEATESKTLQDIIVTRYTTKIGEVNPSKAHLRKEITYSSPRARISSYQALDEEQLLEVNKVYAKLAILENEDILKHVISHSSNSKLRETIGNAFSSAEVIHYGDINEENIIEIPKEIADIFALTQQVNDIDEDKIEELKRALIISVQNRSNIPEISDITLKVRDNISIEEMYELTEGKVEYGKANSIVKNMFYLSKARKNAIALADILEEILQNNLAFKDIIGHIRENGFRIEPEIVSRKSGKGIQLSESVNLNLTKEEQSLIDEIKELSSEELDAVLQNGGLYNARDIITKIFSNISENEKIDKARYYAGAIVAQYNWQDIGIEEIKTDERNELIARLQEKNCAQIYERLKEAGTEENKIPTVLFNIALREGIYEQYANGNLKELLSTRQDVLQDNINIELVERFLGYYDIENTGIKLKDYQKRANDNVNRIFKDHKFAQVILPTGAGKSFVALAQMQKYAEEHPNEKILYLAPQDEILNQIKKYIVKYVHGKQETLGKSEDEIIAEVFPNITFETYPGLLAKRGKKVIKDQYGLIILDELHRTGAPEWEEKIDTLFENQTENVKVLGITATPTRDADGRDMAEETAKKLGYTDEEISKRKHLASNMTLENAIRMGYVVNPKIVYCKYDLISSGKMDELRVRIDDIEDEEQKAEKLQKYNELRVKLNKEIKDEIGEEESRELEEIARKNLDSGIGKEEILRRNVKKGGRYIVFIPVSDQGDIEDEDGNRIGIKTGEDKIKAYYKYLNKTFEGTDIVPDLHSMLGSYSTTKNKKELDAFESDNSDKTKFMVVMNKANEGIHVEGVDGIIWFRALDENSRILYLQQLGRAIYALDEDNPLPNDKRPIVIDLANNSLTVKIEKYFENIGPIDDLESLIIVTEWMKEHDGIIPDRNSSNKQEQHYYAILRRIKNKYSKYLDGFDNLEDLTEEDKSRIEEIIELASEIDLWNIDLPSIQKTKGNKEEFDPFTIEGILKDFVEFEQEIYNIKSKRIIARFIEIAEKLKKEGVNVGNLSQTRAVKKDEITTQEFNTLQDLVEKGEISKEILERLSIDENYKIGYYKYIAKSTYNGTANLPITEKEKRKLEELGIVNLEEEKTIIAKFIEIAEKLNNAGIEVDKFQEKTKRGYNTLQDFVEKGEIPEELLKQLSIDGNYKIGYYKRIAKLSYNGKVNYPITEGEKTKLEELGIVSLKIKKTVIQEFIEIAEKLKNEGIEVKNLSQGKNVGNKKILYTLQDLVYKGEISQGVLEKTGLTGKYKLGYYLGVAKSAYYGNNDFAITDEERRKLEELGIVNLGIKKTVIAEFIEIIEKLKNEGIEVENLSQGRIVDNNNVPYTLQDLVEKGEIPEETIAKLGLDITYKIGHYIRVAKKAYKGIGSNPITDKEKRKLEELKIVNLEEKTVIQEFIEIAEKLKNEGIEVENLSQGRIVGSKRITYTLQDLVEKGEISEEIIEKLDLDRTYKIGYYKGLAKRVYRDDSNCPITEEEKRKLEELGIVSLEIKKTIVAEFIEIAEKLKNEGIKVEKLLKRRIADNNGIPYTLQDLVEKGEIPEEILEKLEMDGKYKFGYYMRVAIKAYNGVGNYLITEGEKRKLEELRIVSLEIKKTVVAEFIEIAEKLKNGGIEVGKLTKRRTIKKDGKKIKEFTTFQDLIKRGEILEEILEKLEIDDEYKIGYYMRIAINAYNGVGNCPITEEEKRKLENLGIIRNLNKAKQQRDEAQQKNNQVKGLEQQVSEQYKKRSKKYEEQ